MIEFQYMVIGAGLMGSAAARYLSHSADTLIIGQPEPAAYAQHDGVFASHYDQGRIVYQLGKDALWAQLGIQSIANFAQLEARSGIQFHHPAGVLYVNGEAATKYARHVAALSAQLEVVLAHYQTAPAITESHPELRFPDSCAAYFEPAPGGTINPRDLVRAQLAVAAQQGAAVVSDLVVAVEASADFVTAHTRSGASYRAKQLLLATGAFANTLDLLPQPLDLRVKSEVMLLAQVGSAEQKRLQQMPAVLYAVDHPTLDEIYTAPPLRYPDGNTYIKMGCNTPTDRWLSTLAEMQAWMQSGDTTAVQPAMADALLAMMPDLHVERFVMKRCLITYTPSGHPFVGQVADRLFVATGGNGSSAKCSDALGRIAAEQVRGVGNSAEQQALLPQHMA